MYGGAVDHAHVDHAHVDQAHVDQAHVTMRMLTYLGIVGPSDHKAAIRAVCKRGHVVKVPLLLEDVGFAAPLPHQQLAGRCRPQCQPLPWKKRNVKKECDTRGARGPMNNNRMRRSSYTATALVLW